MTFMSHVQPVKITARAQPWKKFHRQSVCHVPLEALKYLEV